MIGIKIKQLRRLKEVTQKELGLLLGCSEAQISYIESGNRKILTNDIKKLADFFCVPYDYFFEEKQFVNFRYNNKNINEEKTKNDLMSDFRKFAIKKIYGNKKNR